MDFPVYEFRPLTNSFRPGYEVRRYADGNWISDDGEHDIAFIADGTCLYFQHSYHRNIICSWLTTHWSGHVAAHPRGGNAWHYALKHGASDWGDTWNRLNHPNERAGKAGMEKIVSEIRGASGHHVEFHADDPIIAAGLLRDRETKTVFEWPSNMTCMYCGISPILKCDEVAVA